MNCHQCDEDIYSRPAYTLTDSEDTSVEFCSLGCLQQWVKPDRPLTRRVEQAANAAPSPQHVVGGNHHCGNPGCPLEGRTVIVKGNCGDSD